MSTRTRTSHSLSVFALAVLATLPTAAFAQSWEVYSGLNPHREQLHGVADVQFCAGGGQVATGTQIVPPTVAGFNNIVVERKNAANPIAGPWRFSYDSGRSEEGRGIVEYTDGTGFAIVGTFDTLATPVQTHLTISKVDCNGNMVWHRGYSWTAGSNVSWDIIRASTGTPALNTNPGDLIALGEYTVNGLNYARIVRVKSQGQLIWTRDYGVAAGLQLYSRGIAEVDTPSATDHLVVAGGLGNNATIFEVDGDNGTFVCGTQSPGLGVSRFNDITRHGGVTSIAPGFTAVGETRAPAGGSSQAYVASYTTGPAAPCALTNQVQWGSSAANESAQAVTTTYGNTFTSVPVGSLLIAGNIVGPYSTNPNSADVWTHVMTPIALTPFSSPSYTTGQRFGTFMAGLSGGETVADVTESTNGGFFVGTTFSPWISGDLQHGYTTWMRAANTGTQCSVPWSAPVTTLTLSSAFVLPSTRFDPSVILPALPRSPINAAYCCNIGP